MFLILIFCFTVVPIAELYVLIKVGQHIGAVNTIALVLFISALGAYIACREGLRVLYSVQQDLQEGRMPAPQLLDGFLILIGAILLITPGFLTDCMGLFFIFPLTRPLIKMVAKWYPQRMIDQRSGVITIKSYTRKS